MIAECFVIVFLFNRLCKKDFFFFLFVVPPQPDDRYINLITSGSTVRHKTTTTAVIFLPLFPIDNGDVKYYAIMVSQKGHNEQSSGRLNLENDSWPNVSNWKEAMMKEFTITYQPTQQWWNPYKGNIFINRYNSAENL